MIRARRAGRAVRRIRLPRQRPCKRREPEPGRPAAPRAPCEHAVVGSAGSPNALFRRALATNNVTLANTAALEAGRLNLADALSLTLLYRDQAPDLFERAAVRWHSRFCREVRNVAAEDAQLALAALMALDGPRPDTGARALLSLFGALVERRCALPRCKARVSCAGLRGQRPPTCLVSPLFPYQPITALARLFVRT
jgi:hypothetical protein